MRLEDILLADDVVKSIQDHLDYLLEIIPELQYMIGFEHHHPHHHLDVWNHTLLALSLSSKDFDTRLCLLLHDIGKPFSYQDDEVRHFYGHAKVSSDMAKPILKRLGYEDYYIQTICTLIEHHDTPITDEEIATNYDYCVKLFEVQKCDALAHHPDKLEKRKVYLSKVKEKIYQIK